MLGGLKFINICEEFGENVLFNDTSPSLRIWAFGIMSGQYSFLSLQITRVYIKPRVKWTVNLIADGHYNFPQGFV